MNRKLMLLGAALLVAAAGRAIPVGAAPSMAPQKAQPGHEAEAFVQLADFNQWLYLPAIRYSKSGNTIAFDYEYASDFFGPARPDFGNMPVSLGVLAPGNYVASIRLIDMARPDAAPELHTSTLTVSPPGYPGVYVVPEQPRALQSGQAVVVSAYHFDPATLRVALDGRVVRIGYDYAADQPADGPGAAGLVTWATLDIPALAPGDWILEAMGTPTDGSAGINYLRWFSVNPATSVVEFYAESTDHYFMAAGADEIALLDRPASGWKRTGQRFNAFPPATAPAEARPVCRFYASGPNSHFYTADANECAQLRDLEAMGRADAQKSGVAFGGWAYEGIAFHALVPVNGQCPEGTEPVMRAYNNRAAENDSNHRFAASTRVYAAMTFTWGEEGVVFCSPL